MVAPANSPLRILTVPSGADLYIGTPANPLPEETTQALRRQLSATAAVLEAYLPQCFIPGAMDTPAQVLVVVLNENTPVALLVERLSSGIATVLSSGMFLDVWPLKATDELLESVRETACRLL